MGEDLCVYPSLALSFLGLYRGLSSYPRAPSLISGVPWALGSRDDHARAPPGRYLERYCVHVGTLLCTRGYTIVYTWVHYCVHACTLLYTRVYTFPSQVVGICPLSIHLGYSYFRIRSIPLGDFVLALQRIHESTLGKEVQNS